MEKQLTKEQIRPTLKVIREEDETSMIRPVKPEQVKLTKEIIRKASKTPSGYIKCKKHDFF